MLKNEPNPNQHTAGLRAVGAEAIVAWDVQRIWSGRENPFSLSKGLTAGEAGRRPTIGEIEAVKGEPQLVAFADRNDLGKARVGTVLRRQVEAVYGQKGHATTQARAVYIEVGKHAGDGRIVDFHVRAAVRL